MNHYAAIWQRFMHDDVPASLGGLVANLRRVESAATHDEHQVAVEGLLDEGKHYIEWTAAKADMDKVPE